MNYGKIRKFRRNVKAISPIIATLLLIAIAVVAALVTYAWVMGYIGFQTSNAGKSVQIQSVDTSKNYVYVENVGTGSVSFSDPCVYINGAEVVTGATGGAAYTIAPGSTLGLSLGSYTWTSGDTYTIKVVTTSGTFNQMTITP